MKISRICSASSANTIDSFIQTLNRDVEQTGIQFLIDSGWDDSTAKDYFSCRTSYKEDSSMIEVAVGAELDFDELMELAETLDTVINKYDENAYFDAEDAGRLSAYLEVPQNIEMSTVTGAKDDFEIRHVDQEYDSAATSINSKKLPAIYNLVEFHPGELALDYGGGKTKM